MQLTISIKRCMSFVRAAQAFCVTGLLTYALSVIILIAYLTVQFLQKVKGVLIVLCLLIFTSGCMTLLALVVMGIKGHDHLTELKMDDREVLRLLATGVDILGRFYIGWSFVVALISALVTLSSFLCCMVEVVHVSEISKSTMLIVRLYVIPFSCIVVCASNVRWTGNTEDWFHFLSGSSGGHARPHLSCPILDFTER
ncbi:hypothetical protein RRG08_002929 [Elysia crispata]|uniref:Uncharacterized protein n=1 Tax=Elysia crispata TaxID=231223 RepID=A0AAE1APH5_9GAST|nr:hypothetical protein RRG08_002929 [Elysia crispata]